MTISLKQLEANRMNALKSTGPKTQDGKAIVALNPIKHGLLSKEILLQDEDETSLVDLGKKLRYDLAPAGEMEILLVDRIISAAWRLRRILKIEQQLLDKNMPTTMPTRKKNPLPEDPYKLWKSVQYNFGNIQNIQRYESHIERGMYKALHELQRLQATRQGEHVSAPAVVDVDGITLQSAQ
jgi:hypothetical protein